MGQRGACARKRLFDVHGHLSLTGSARFGYGSPRGVEVPNGEFGGGRERPPPFLVPGSGTAALRNSHLRNTPWEGRSRPNYPCGKATAKIPEDLLWPSKASIPPLATTWPRDYSRLLVLLWYASKMKILRVCLSDTGKLPEILVWCSIEIKPRWGNA